MTKLDVLDDVIEILIRKAMDDDVQKHKSTQSELNLTFKGEKVNGLPSASRKRKPTRRIQ